MTFKAATCPNCGGALQVPDDRTTVKCMYCGVDVIIREAIQAAAGANLGNLLKLANAAGQAGNHQEAYSYYTKVLEVESSNWKAWMGRAEAAGWMSQPQQFRLPEMLSGIRNALEAAPPDQRKQVESVASSAIVRVALHYNAQMRAWFYNLLGDPNYWHQFLTQCSTLIQVLEEGHRLFPKDTGIVNAIIQICSDTLPRTSYMGTMNHRQVQMWREVPDDFKVTLRAKIEYYSNILRELDPFAPPPRVPQLSFFESLNLNKVPVPIWIGLGLVAFIFMGILGSIADKGGRSRSDNTTTQNSTTRQDYSTPMPSPAASNNGRSNTAARTKQRKADTTPTPVTEEAPSPDIPDEQAPTLKSRNANRHDPRIISEATPSP